MRVRIDRLERLNNWPPRADPTALLLRVGAVIVVLVDQVPSAMHVVVKEHLVPVFPHADLEGTVPHWKRRKRTAVSRHGSEVVAQRGERDVSLPVVVACPIEHQEMGRSLGIVGDERFDAEAGSVGRREIQPSIDVAARRRRTNIVASDARSLAPAGLERGRVKVSISDSARKWLLKHRLGLRT